MGSKLAFVFVGILVVIQMVTWGVANPRQRRDEAQEKNVSQKLEEAFNSFKNDLDDLVKNIQSNELFQNLSQQVQEFGLAVQNQSKQIVNKLQGDAA